MKSFTDISHFPPQTHGISRQKEPLLTPDPLPPLHLAGENHMTPISIQSPLITNHPILSAIHNLPEIIRTLTRTLRKVSLKRSCLCDSKRLIYVTASHVLWPQPIQVFEYCLVLFEDYVPDHFPGPDYYFGFCPCLLDCLTVFKNSLHPAMCLVPDN